MGKFGQWPCNGCILIEPHLTKYLPVEKSHFLRWKHHWLRLAEMVHSWGKYNYRVKKIKWRKMHLPHYIFKYNNRNTVFNFISEGPRGNIKKSIRYSKTHVKNVYNLAFGDINPITGKIDDTIISDNGDSSTVLATVAATIYLFTRKYPNAYILIIGSTKSRTRLYQMSIRKYLSIINEDFDIYAKRNEKWEKFKKGINYDSFLVKRNCNLELWKRKNTEQ